MQGCILLRSEPETGAATERQDESPFHLLERGNIEEQIRTRTLQLARHDELRLLRAEAGYYMDVQEARLRQTLPLNTAVLSREGDSIMLRIEVAFAFNADSSRLNPAAQTILHTIAHTLSDLRKSFVVVSSNTDRFGDADYNRRLSDRRALAVARSLIGYGIRKERIAIVRNGNRPARAKRTIRTVSAGIAPSTSGSY